MGSLATSVAPIGSRDLGRQNLAIVMSIAILHVAIMISGVPTLVKGRQYCHNEIFRAECPPGQAILATSAVYGRMTLGRCVKTDFGFVGCHVDVIDHVHRRCSGRRVCNVRVPDSTLDRTRPCNDDLKSYLEVSYICIAVAMPDNGNCQLSWQSVKEPPLGPRNNEDTEGVRLIGYLGTRQSTGIQDSMVSGVDPVGGECGSERSPWVVTAHSGQRVRLVVMDFTTPEIALESDEEMHEELRKMTKRHDAGSSTSSSGDSSKSGLHTLFGHCVRHYATVVDLSNNRTVEICGSRGHGEDDVIMTSSVDVDRLTLTSDPYTTEGHRAAIVVHTAATTSRSVPVFMVRCEAVGCADLKEPPGGNVWIHRTEDRVTMGCVVSPRSSPAPITWHLFCIDGRWEGVWRNCSLAAEVDLSETEGEASSSLMLYNGFAIGIILSVSLLMGLLVTIVGICFMHRYWRDPVSHGWLKAAKGVRPTLEGVSIEELRDRRWQRTGPDVTEMPGCLTDGMADMNSCVRANVIGQQSADETRYLPDFILCQHFQDDVDTAASFTPIHETLTAASSKYTAVSSPSHHCRGEVPPPMGETVQLAASAAAEPCSEHCLVGHHHPPCCWRGDGVSPENNWSGGDQHAAAASLTLGRRADYDVVTRSISCDRNTLYGHYRNNRLNIRTPPAATGFNYSVQ